MNENKGSKSAPIVSRINYDPFKNMENKIWQFIKLNV
jgi:hypothetical protein